MTVRIACCPVHGLHGQRTECFVCGGTVEQVAMERRDELVRLAELALEVLDSERAETGVDEWDESDPRCYLYNAATAVVEGRSVVEALEGEE